MRKWVGVVPALALVVLLGLLVQRPSEVKAQGAPVGEPFTCSVAAVGAADVLCQPAPPPGMSLYVTDIVISSSTTTGASFFLDTSSLNSCGAATTAFPSAGGTGFGYPPSTSAALTITLSTPLKLGSAKALCVLCTAVNTCNAQIMGRIGVQ